MITGSYQLEKNGLGKNTEDTSLICKIEVFFQIVFCQITKTFPYVVFWGPIIYLLRYLEPFLKLQFP